MAEVRVFLPCTLRGLVRVLADGQVGPPPLAAFAVTPALREWYAEGDLEELEYVALTEAARASLRLLDAELVDDPAAPPRRVVLAADVDARHVQGAAPRDGERGQPVRSAVTLAGPVPLRAVVSAHVDDAEAEAAVAAAAASVVAAELGSEDAQFALDEAEGHELLWFHPSEFELLVLEGS